MWYTLQRNESRQHKGRHKWKSREPKYFLFSFVAWQLAEGLIDDQHREAEQCKLEASKALQAVLELFQVERRRLDTERGRHIQHDVDVEEVVLCKRELTVIGRVEKEREHEQRQSHK